MGWIGQTDLDYAGFDPDGLRPGSNCFSLPDQNAILPVGSMVIETTFAARAGKSQHVLRLQRRDGWRRVLRVALRSDGTLSLLLRQGMALFKTSIAMTLPSAESFLRITFSWDAPAHHVVVTGAEAEYQLGESAVLVAVAHLAGGRWARRERPAAPVLRYFHVLLHGHDCINHSGAWAESLFVGPIARLREVMKTTVLAGLPFSGIPSHEHPALPVLDEIQARALAHSISA